MMAKRILSLLTCAACTFSLVMPVYADSLELSSGAAGAETEYETMYDAEREGTIRIDYKDSADGSGPVSGAEFSYYKLADLEIEANDASDDADARVGSWYHSILEGIEVDGDTEAADIKDAVLEAYKDQKVERGITDADGIATTKLETGAYLAVETRPAMDHLPSAPFIFTVPASVTDGEKTVGWDYSVEAEPKSKPIRIGTTLTDKQIHESGFGENVRLVDKIKYEGLVPGEHYRFEGSLYLKSTGAPLGVRSAIDDFVPEEADGYAEMEFFVDTTSLAGDKIVAFEDLFIAKISKDETDVNHGPVEDEDGTEHDDDLDNNPTNQTCDGEDMPEDTIRVTTHSEIESEEQTAHVAKILTSLRSDSGKLFQGGKTTLTDTVSIQGLIVGNTYRLDGVLMDAESKQSTGISNPVTFTATAETMDVDIPFTADFTEYAGKRLVAFEKLYWVKTENTPEPEDGEELPDEVLITTHEDFESTEQTINVVSIGTTLRDNDTNLHEAEAKKESVWTDYVAYTGLIPNHTYVAKCTVMDKAKKEPVTVNGKPVTGEQEFTPSSPSGYVKVTVNIDTEKLAGIDAVAFEEVYAPAVVAEFGTEEPGGDTPENDEPVLIAEHKDFEDQSQTVRVIKIGTTLTEKSTGKKTVEAKKGVKVVDKIAIEGAVKGNTYIIEGTLYDLAGKKLTNITAQKKFVAKSSSMTVDLPFPAFDATKYEGMKLVAFEKLYRVTTKGQKIEEETNGQDIPELNEKVEEKVVVATHEDENDKEQTITVDHTTKRRTTTRHGDNPSTRKAVKTGDYMRLGLFIVLFLLAAAVIIAALKGNKK